MEQRQPRSALDEPLLVRMRRNDVLTEIGGGAPPGPVFRTLVRPFSTLTDTDL